MLKQQLFVRILFLALPLLVASAEAEEAGKSTSVASSSLSNQAAAAQLELALQSLESADVLGSIVSYTLPGRDPVTATHGFVDIQQTVAMDASRLFQIGSQTKMFTAAAILLLQRDGQLNLDDLVSKYVSGVARPADLTIRQLLTHTGGIGDSITFFDPPAGRRPDFDVSFDNHLFLGRVAGEEFAPGSDWNYNNLGFVVLGRVIESASGLSLEAYTRKNILDPLGMTETFLGNLESYPESRMARGYFSQDGETVDTTMPNLTWASSAGDVVSGMDDMHKWALMLLNADNPLGLSLADFAVDPIDVSDFGGLARYGLGMMERRVAGQKLWGHGGFIHGYVTLTLVEPESGIILQLMTSLKDDSEDIIAALETVAAIALNLAQYEAHAQ